EVEFRRVTTAVGGHLLLLSTASPEDLAGIVPVSWAPDGCLFASLGGSTSAGALIHIEGGKAGEATLGQKIPWKAGRNAYSFPVFSDQQPGETKMMPPAEPYKWKAWKDFTGETESRLDMVKFSNVPENLALARPDSFSLPGLDDFGAPAK